MRQSTISLLDALHRARDADDLAILLQRIADAGEPLAIPQIISLCLDPRGDVAEVAGDAVRRLRRLVGARDLGLLDRALREHGTTRWRDMAPADLRTVVRLHAGPTLLQLAMCHPSGYVRAEAIRRAATSSDGAELAFLLLRTNDWVAPVRELARSALRARLAVDHVPDLIAALPIVDAMPHWGRLGSTQIVEEIEALLRDPRALPALRDGCGSPDRFVRRAVYRRLLAIDAGVMASAMHDADPAIRAWASHSLLGAGDAVFASFADRLLHSRLGAVRFGAAWRLRALGEPLPWAELLLDSHADVRALAQEVALDAGAEPDTEYRIRSASLRGARLATALLGLSETGGPNDEAQVRRALADERPTVRRSALRALATFEVADIIALALAALRDASPSVARAARDVLLANRRSVRPADVWSAYTESTTTWGRRSALAVLARSGFWEILPYLLRAYDGPDHELLRDHLARWLARQRSVFTPPPARIADEVRAILDEGSLPERTRAELARLVRR